MPNMPTDDSLTHAIAEEVCIAAHDSRWAAQFVEERDRLWDLFPGRFAAIEHVGSTAVPRLAAKPIIDIQVSVAALQPLSAYGIPLEAIGYVHLPHPDDAFCPFFHRPMEWPHTHHVHFVERGGSEERRTLAFRDYLREHPHTAHDYEQLKRALTAQLAASDHVSRERYARAKTDFIERVIALAMAGGA